MLAQRIFFVFARAASELFVCELNTILMEKEKALKAADELCSPADSIKIAYFTLPVGDEAIFRGIKVVPNGDHQSLNPVIVVKRGENYFPLVLNFPLAFARGNATVKSLDGSVNQPRPNDFLTEVYQALSEGRGIGEYVGKMFTHKQVTVCGRTVNIFPAV